MLAAALYGLIECAPLSAAGPSMPDKLRPQRADRLPLLTCSHVFNDFSQISFGSDSDVDTPTATARTSTHATQRVSARTLERNNLRRLLRMAVKSQLERSVNDPDSSSPVNRQQFILRTMPEGTFPLTMRVVLCPHNCRVVSHPVQVAKRLSTVCRASVRHSKRSLRGKWVSVQIRVPMSCECV